MKKQLFLGLSALLLLASCGGTPETSALDSSVAGSDSSSLPVSSEPVSSSEPINSAAMLDGFITKLAEQKQTMSMQIDNGAEDVFTFVGEGGSVGENRGASEAERVSLLTDQGDSRQ